VAKATGIAIAVLLLAGCGSASEATSVPAEPSVNERIAESLDGEWGAGAQKPAGWLDFVEALSQSEMSRPYWTKPNHAAVIGISICDVDGAAVRLADEGIAGPWQHLGPWDYDDAEIFVDAAETHLCGAVQ
jgi:hypothetical protein